MAKTSGLRGQILPRDVWDFLDSNVPTLIVRLLHGYIEELEKQNGGLWDSHRRLSAKIDEQDKRIEVLEDELTRLKGERVKARPVNSPERSKLKEPRPPVRRPLKLKF